MNLKQFLKKVFKYTFRIILALIITSILFVNFHPTFGGNSSEKQLERMKKAANFKDGKFTNIHPVKEDFSWDDYKKMFAKMFKGNPNKQPSEKFPIVQWDSEKIKQMDASKTTAVWYGHSTFYLKMNGKNILIDPMFGDYPSPVPYIVGKRYNDLPITIADLPEIDIILISHDHYDHLDYGSIKKLKEKTTQFIVPLGVGAHLEKWGVAKNKITELYWNEGITIDEITFTCTPAQHFSGRGLTDKQKTLWCSWVIDGKQKIFFSGDSGYFDGFKEIGNTHGPFDICMLECGQYDELWKDIHMMPEETAQAYLDLKGELLIPIHWGGFTLANHDWNDPIKRLSKVAIEKKINLAIPIVGEEIFIGEPQEFSDWWKEIK